MTPEEYKQLKAFARQDGALLSLLWIGAMACYIQGLSSPILGMIAMLLIILSPFYAANRLRHFRDEARAGIISFMRAYGYTVLTYFYAGLLLAVAVFIYFHFKCIYQYVTKELESRVRCTPLTQARSC